MTLNQLRRTWGQALRDVRVRRGMSLATLSKITAVSPGHLSRVENGLAGLGDEYRAAVAEALGVRVEEIWSYTTAVS